MKWYILIIIFCPLLIKAQFKLINHSFNIKVNSGTTLRVKDGGLKNTNSASIKNNGNIYISDDFDQQTSSTYTGNIGSWLYFEGGGDQYINGDALVFVPKLKADNGNKVILNTNVNVEHEVSLTNNSHIELGVNNLIIQQGGVVSDYDKDSYVITNSSGYLQQYVSTSDVFFPVGNSTYNPAILSNLGTLDRYQVRVNDYLRHGYPVGDSATQDAVFRTWRIAEKNVGDSDVQMTLQWEQSQELLNFDRNSSGVSRWNGTFWDRPTSWGAATNVTGTIWRQTRSGIKNFSPFIVEDNSQTLPIQFYTFDAERLSNEIVQLKWETAISENNEGFFVERMLDNELGFQEIDFVESENSDNTTIERHTFLDHNIYQEISYYRIKQVDLDGQFCYSDIKSVKGNQEKQNLDILVYPNPTDSDVSLTISHIPIGTNTLHIEIVDLHGRILEKKSIPVAVNNNVTQQLSFNQLTAGCYLLIAQLDDGEKSYKRIVKY